MNPQIDVQAAAERRREASRVEDQTREEAKAARDAFHAALGHAVAGDARHIAVAKARREAFEAAVRRWRRAIDDYHLAVAEHCRVDR